MTFAFNQSKSKKNMKRLSNIFVLLISLLLSNSVFAQEDIDQNGRVIAGDHHISVLKKYIAGSMLKMRSKDVKKQLVDPELNAVVFRRATGDGKTKFQLLVNKGRSTLFETVLLEEEDYIALLNFAKDLR
jgi:hypothetical protein